MEKKFEITKEENLKEVIKEILFYLEKLENKNNELKELKKDIQEEYAMIKGYRKKNGEIDKNAIKISELLNAAKNVFENDQSFELKIANYETYKTDIKNGEENCPVSKIKKYLEKEKELKDLKNELREFEKDITTNEKFNVDGKTFKLILNTIKKEFKKKNKEKNSFNEFENNFKEKIKEIFLEVKKSFIQKGN